MLRLLTAFMVDRVITEQEFKQELLVRYGMVVESCDSPIPIVPSVDNTSIEGVRTGRFTSTHPNTKNLKRGRDDG